MNTKQRAQEWLDLVRTLTDACQQLERLAIGDLTTEPSRIKHLIYPLVEDARNQARDWWMREEDDSADS